MQHQRSHLLPIAALLAGAALLAPARAEAQSAEIKPARLEYEFYPGAAVHGPTASSPESEAHFQSARASLSLPTPVGGGTYLIPGLRYQLLDIGQQASTATTPNVEALHSLVLSLGVVQPLGSDVSLFAQLGGGLAGDLAGEVASDDWIVSAQALALWNIIPDFTLGAGLGYDRRTGDVRPLPLLAFNWEPRPDLLVRGVLPQFLALRYRAATPVTLALEASLEGERYHLAESGVGVAHAEVAHSVAKVGPSVTLHWTNWFHTRLSGGAVVRRRFEVYVDDVSRSDLRVDNSPYVGLELWFGPSGWSSDAVETALESAGPSS
jgi:uncharacterized protein DUF6268